MNRTYRIQSVLALVLLCLCGVLSSPQSSSRRRGGAIFSASEGKVECLQTTIAGKVERAPTVVTGKVERTFDTKIIISVKRTIKGDPALTGKQLSIIDSALSRHVCSSVVRLNEEDVRIFYLQRNPNNNDDMSGEGDSDTNVGYILNSEPNRVTYRNLHEVNSAVKDGSTDSAPLPYRDVIEKPCEVTYCPFNADCVEINGRAECRCPGGCSLYGDPVCGSDGVTYSSECHLKATSCSENKRVFVAYEGVCVTPRE